MRPTAWRVLLLAVLLGPVAYAQPASPSSAAGLPWVPFRWFSAQAGLRQIAQAALLIPADLSQVSGRQELQLDLGSESTLLYGGAVQLKAAAKAELAATGAVTLSGAIAGHKIKAERVGLIPDYVASVVRGQPMAVIGSVGLRFFERRVLVVDFPNRRVAVLREGAPVPALIERTATFLPITYRNGKLYLPTEIGGTMHADAFFFDTGAGPFPLVTSRDEWRRLTDRSEDDAGNETLTVSGWGVDLTLVGGPSKVSLRVGPAEIGVPTVYFVRDPPGAISFDR